MVMNQTTVKKKTLSPTAYHAQIAALTDWESAVSMGVTFVEHRDEWSWALGELASYIRTSTLTGGRPVGGERQGTLSAFADSIGMRRESLSAMCWNFEFYAEMRDTLPENVTWHQLSEARRRSGWRPGMGITPEFQERAMQFAEEYADEVPPKRKRTLADILADECDRLAALADRPDMPTPVSLALRAAKTGIDKALEFLEEKEVNINEKPH